MRYSDFKIFRFDFVSLYCLIYKIAQDMNAGNTVFSQLMSLIPDYEFRKCIDPVKCSKSRLVTTSAIKHFIAKVAEFYPKSGVVLGASIYVLPLHSRHSSTSEATSSITRASSPIPADAPTRSLSRSLSKGK